MPVTRHDIQSAEDRFMFYSGIGFFFGIPTRAGSANLTTGVPTNGIGGWVPGALFFNFLGALGSFLYVNVGSKTSTTWLNIA